MNQSKLSATPLTQRITFVYLVISLLWIALSDYLLAVLVTDPKLYQQIQTYKGWGFVLATSLLLYWLIRREVSHFQKADEAIQQRMEQMQWITETVTEGLLLLDQQQRIIHLNPAAERYLSHLSDARLGKPLTSLAGHPLDSQILTGSSNEWVNEWVQEIEVETDNMRLLFAIRAHPKFDGDTLSGWVLVIRDVTSERQQQQHIQQQERLAAIGQLASGIAHDFNNIMAIIVLYSQLLRHEKEISDKGKQRLTDIYQQALHASKLIEQILDFSRSSIIERSHINLTPLLKEMLKLWQRTLPETVSITLDLEPGDYIIHADPTRIQQMLMNLVVNARDALPEGGQLTLHLAQVVTIVDQPPPLPNMPAGHWVRLYISDNGPGIPSDVLPHIFEPFFTTKEPGQGTGLGLAQVYGIVEQHNGFIGVQSQLGDGTTFVIYLPLLKTDVHEAEAKTADLTAPTHTATILLVEDNPFTRQAIADSLGSVGYRVLTAENGQEAIDLLQQYKGHIDLVISDIVMPIMGGIELYQRLKQENRQLYMLLITGYPLHEEQQVLEDQNIEWLRKPFTSHDLVAKLDSILVPTG